MRRRRSSPSSRPPPHRRRPRPRRPRPLSPYRSDRRLHAVVSPRSPRSAPTSNRLHRHPRPPPRKAGPGRRRRLRARPCRRHRRWARQRRWPHLLRRRRPGLREPRSYRRRRLSKTPNTMRTTIARRLPARSDTQPKNRSVRMRAPVKTSVNPASSPSPRRTGRPRGASALPDAAVAAAPSRLRDDAPPPVPPVQARGAPTPCAPGTTPGTSSSA